MKHVLSTHQHGRDRKSGISQSLHGAGPGPRCGYGPTSDRQGLEQLGRSLDRLKCLDCAVLIGHKGGDLCRRIEVRSGQLDGFYCTPAMTDAQKWLGGESLRDGPATPLALDVGC